MSRSRKTVLRPEVAWFAEQMELALRKNDHKGGWEHEDEKWLVKRIADERGELKRAIGRLHKSCARPEVDTEPLKARVIAEAADVANFAMMIADNMERWP